MCLKVRLGLFGDSGGGLASKFIKSKIFKRKTKKQPEDAESTTKKKFNNLKIKMKSTDFLKRRAKEPSLPFTKEETIDMSILENPELKNTVVETEIEDESTGDHIEENSQRSVEKSAINLRKAITGSGKLFFELN